jgi:hypothetical protein
MYSCNVTQVEQFNNLLAIGNLMKKLKEKAASSNDSRVKYATGNETDVSLNFQTIYGLVQCTPDLSFQDCTRCLDDAIYEITTCCNNKMGGRVVKPSCKIRFELIVGLLCVQEDIAMRPTMSSVLTMLNSTSFPLPEPLEPPFSAALVSIGISHFI